MKIKMHYAYGKNKRVACGAKARGNVFMTTNYMEITCGRCLKTYAHKNVKQAAVFVPQRPVV